MPSASFSWPPVAGTPSTRTSRPESGVAQKSAQLTSTWRLSAWANEPMDAVSKTRAGGRSFMPLVCVCLREHALRARCALLSEGSKHPQHRRKLFRDRADARRARAGVAVHARDVDVHVGGGEPRRQLLRLLERDDVVVGAVYQIDSAAHARQIRRRVERACIEARERR